MIYGNNKLLLDEVRLNKISRFLRGEQINYLPKSKAGGSIDKRYMVDSAYQPGLSCSKVGERCPSDKSLSIG